MLIAEPAHEKLMAHSTVYRHGTEAIEQYYIRWLFFRTQLLTMPPTSNAWLSYAHFSTGPRSRAFPGASICHSVPSGFSSGIAQFPRHHSSIIAPSHNLVPNVVCSPIVSSLRHTHAAAIRVDVNEPTNPERKLLSAQQRSGKARLSVSATARCLKVRLAGS